MCVLEYLHNYPYTCCVGCIGPNTISIVQSKLCVLSLVAAPAQSRELHVLYPVVERAQAEPTYFTLLHKMLVWHSYTIAVVNMYEHAELWLGHLLPHRDYTIITAKIRY